MSFCRHNYPLDTIWRWSDLSAVDGMQPTPAVNILTRISYQASIDWLEYIAKMWTRHRPRCGHESDPREPRSDALR